MIDEKAFEAIRLTLEWDERRGYLMPYTVRDKLRLAYESAKQKGEAEGWVLVPKDLAERAQHVLSASEFPHNRRIAAEISALLSAAGER